MHKRPLIVMMTFVLMSCSPQVVSGFFQDEARGIRPAGMGEAFVGVADDANAVLYNPAGFSRISEYELVGMYASLYSGLDPQLYNGNRDRLGYNFLSLAIPVSESVGNFGASWTQLHSVFYQENTMSISYARRVWSPYKLDVGTNLKQLSWEVGSNEYTQGLSRHGFTLDLGALATVWPNVQVGLGVDNVLPVNMGVDEAELVPRTVRFGGAYFWPLQWGYFGSLLTQVEFSARGVEYANGAYNTKVGLEGMFFDKILALRVGANQDCLTSGMSVSFDLRQPFAFHLDYAYTLPFQMSDTLGSHRVGITAHVFENVPEKVNVAQVMPVATPTPIPEEVKQLTTEIQNVQMQIEEGALKPIYFDSNKSTIKPISYTTLDLLGKILEKYPTLRIRIEGYTDSYGNAEYNKSLSQTRVEATREYLITHFKIAPENMLAVGFGAANPIANNDVPEGRGKNRRVEFRVLSQNEGNANIEINADSTAIKIEHQ